jgi:hypothetical protein
MLSVPRFQELFPAFTDAVAAGRAIAVVTPITNGYEGIENEATREIALALHVAHYLTVEGWDRSGASGPIKSEKSLNDAIAYAVKETAPGALESTRYGSQLRSLLDSLVI